MEELRSTNALVRVIADTATTMPKTAVSRGSPAASSEPKVMTSATAATARPISSPALCSDFTWTALPPMLTVRPALSPRSATDFRSARARSVTSAWATLYVTWA